MVPVWWIHYHRYQINWISLSFLACPFLLCLWKVSKNLTKCPAQKLDSRLWKRICFFWTLGTCWQIKTAHFVKRIFHFLWFLNFRDFFYLRMIFRAEAKSINKLSPPVKYQRISTQCWRYLFLLLDSFFECSKLMSPPWFKMKGQELQQSGKKWQFRRSMNNFFITRVKR